MIDLKDFIGEEIIYEGKNTLVYRGKSRKDNLSVIIKVSRSDYPSPREISKFRKEYEIGTSLDFEGVSRPLAIEDFRNGLALVLEDFGGVSLHSLIEKKRISLQAFLKIAHRLADVLGQIHRHDIIHMDIKPQNIIINLQTGRVVIADFGISSQLSRENPTIVSPGKLEGTLAYISPEQTGRMNRAIDYRTDLYSLGVTFYEMLTENPPFQSADPMEMVHNHIAVQPRAVHEVRPDILVPVSTIVMRLLAKNAEDRYQSASGLKADIEECLRQLKMTGTIVDFSLGTHDHTGKFQIPQKLYGRENEIEALMIAYKRAVKGRAEIIMVRGFSGIGKSALVNEVHKPMVESRGYFISGKFDQFNRDIPYASLIQAFQELIRQLLTESEDQVATWKKNITDALGPNCQVIIDVIPEVELIIGKQSPVPVLGPTESQYRFNLVLKEFVKTFAKKKHPLVIFLDDLQWADSSTLKLLHTVLTDPDANYLLLICAYRDNEVHEGHPLMHMLDDLHKGMVEPQLINLAPLGVNEVCQLVMETLQTSLEKSTSLARLVHSKTSGNPFFVSEFLKTLYQESLLDRDASTGEWQWDLVKIQRMEITDNVVELMSGKIQKLSPVTQRIVQLAACIGNKFDLSTLSIVNDKTAKQTALDLQEALKEGLILAVGDDYKFNVPDSNLVYKFLHDRVQQAAYSLIESEEKEIKHLAIGRHFLANTPDDSRDDRIFDIVNHLNMGKKLMLDPAERLGAARLNLLAGKKAKASSAFGPGSRFLGSGIELLPEGSWETQHELTLDLFAERADAETLNTNFQESEKLVEEILRNCRDVLEKTRAFEIRIRTLNAEGRLVSALQAAREILWQLGVRLPKNPNFFLHVGPALAITAIRTFVKGEYSLLTAPAMKDPKKMAAMRIMTGTASSAYQNNFNLFSLYIFAMTGLSYTYGLAGETPYGMGLYAMAWTGVLQIYSWGDKYGKLSLQLLEKLDSKEYKSKCIMLYNTFIRHWRSPVKDTFEPLLEGGQAGLNSGDAEYMGYCYFFHGLNQIFSTGRLEPLAKDFQKAHKTVEGYQQGQALNVIKVWGQFVHALLGKNPNPLKLTGDFMEEEKLLSFFHETRYSTGISYLHQAKAMLFYFFGDFKQAHFHIIESRKEEFAVMAMTCSAGLVFYDSLIILKLYTDGAAKERRSYLRRVRKNQRLMKKWVSNNAQSFQHRYDLVEAEFARVKGNLGKALELYDRAIEGSRANQYIMEEALANELAAEFYLSLGKEKVARTYLTDARYGYSRWGSEPKVRDIDRRHPESMRKIMAAEGLGGMETESMTMTTTKTQTGTTTGSTTSSLDLNTVMKASQALSGEIFLDQLLSKLMRIALENAGAQRGSLILEKNDQLVIEAQGSVGMELQVLQAIPMENSDFAAPSIVQYVERTRENVVLGDATNEGRFINTPYILENKPKSILCMPIINQGKLFGILYLENNLTTNAFTPDRVDVLKILMSQAAISLENSRLVAEETERQKLQKEMEMAKDVQMSILPEFPPDDSYNITAHMVPAEQVGGDYYDFYRVNGHRWIAIGDVTGHGLNSGLLMLMAQTGFSTYLNTTSTPDTVELFTSLNKTLHNNMATRTKQGLYMTFTALRADSDGNFEHVGKHEDILVYRKATGKVEIIKSDGFWMGVVPDVSSMIHKANFHLAPGDFITLFTDGVIECRNKAGEQFDTTRLVGVIETKATEGIENVKDAIIKSCMDFMDHMDDDITVFLMQKK